MNTEGYLKAPKTCTFREEGNWIYLKVRGDEYKYPRPQNLITLGKDRFETGENVCCAYNTNSPIFKLDALISLIRAKGSNGLRYYEKDNIIVSDCYAYEDGIIKYVEDDAGNMRVYIGSREYEYCPYAMYYFQDGAQVKKFDRICSGVINMPHCISALGTNLNDIYLVFRKQFYTLTDGEFVSSGITDMGSTQEELIELLFVGLTKFTFDPKTAKLDEIQYQGTQTSVLDKKSFYTVLSYGYSSRIVDKALKGDINLEGDVIISVVSYKI